MANSPETGVVSLSLGRYAMIIALGGFVFGFDAAVISGVIGPISQQFGLSALDQGLVVSAPTLAAVFASLTVGVLSDYIGRKPVMQCLAALYSLSAIFSALAWNFESLVIARAIGGYAFGSLTLAPIYIAELAPSHQRGQYVAYNQLAIVVGLSFAYFSNLFIATIAASDSALASSLMINQYTWNWMLGLEMVPALIWLLMLVSVPESPRWLAGQRRWADAENLLNRLLPRAEVVATLAELKKLVSEKPQNFASRVGDLIHPRMRFVLYIGLLLAIVQQATGINVVFFYAPLILERTGLGSNAALIQTVLIGLINIAFTLVAMAAIDKWGRRPLMIVGLVGVTVSLALVAVSFERATYVATPALVQDHQASIGSGQLDDMVGVVFDDEAGFKAALAERLSPETYAEKADLLVRQSIDINAVLVLVGILGFVASFALSLGPVMWVMLSELFPVGVRGLAMSWVTLFNSGTSWLVQYLFPQLRLTIGTEGVFAVFAITGLFGLILVWRYLPETKSSSLEDLEERLVMARE